jgi:hypothetical protein
VNTLLPLFNLTNVLGVGSPSSVVINDAGAVTQVKTARWVSTSINHHVRAIVKWSGPAASRPSPTKGRTASASAARQAMPRFRIEPKAAIPRR